MANKTIIVSGIKNNGEVDYQEINISDLPSYESNVSDVKIYDEDDGEWYLNFGC